jgi:hypothetical protein
VAAEDLKSQLAEANLIATCDDGRTAGIGEKADLVGLSFVGYQSGRTSFVVYETGAGEPVGRCVLRGRPDSRKSKFKRHFARKPRRKSSGEFD